MKKKLALVVALIVAVLGGCSASSDVTVNVAPSMNLTSVQLKGMSLTDMLNATSGSQPSIVEKEFKLSDGTARFELPIKSMGRYLLSAGSTNIEFWAEPEDELLIQISAPGDYVVKGNAIMNDFTAFSQATKDVDQRYAALMATGAATREMVLPLIDEYQGILKKFIQEHPDSPALPLIMDELEPEDYLSVFGALPEKVRRSPLYPMAELNARLLAEKMEIERKRNQLTSGNVPAPDFTLESINGKKISLSDFKGKWVVLDFWGSWCKWCIKGFPELKKAYQQYAGKLEVIGIDCRESKEEWRAGVERFNLPWINVYNPTMDSGVAKDYFVENFPTKVIVSPEGKVVDITIGEDPEFFVKLASFINK